VFIGHFALGFAAKRARPSVPLPVLFAAAQLADLLWPIFLAVGLEQVRIDPEGTAFAQLTFVSYPYSHALLSLIAWGVLFGAIYAAITRDRAALPLLAALVVSHWALDWLTHLQDLPLYPGGSARVGFGLWNTPPGTLAVELPMYAIGVWIYARTTRARDRIGRWGFIGLVAVLLGAYFASVAGSPPPSVPVLYAVAIVAAALILVWSAWVDTHRMSTKPGFLESRGNPVS